jgi:hypothetical protein
MPKKQTDGDLDCSGLQDYSESGLVRFMDTYHVLGPPVEDPIDLQPPVDPCESVDGRTIRRSCGGGRAPGDDPCYDDV